MAKPRTYTVPNPDDAAAQAVESHRDDKPRPVRNEAQYLAAAARRASNSTVPIPSATRYERRRKHRGRPLDAA